ncbi:ParB family chromosome partitioning protein [Bradyrhizobium diazoefficiens]|uniref:ParB-like partition proteins n=1 Tax=Bradyrhizobium diazoefficiens TaxID=1355477 RepID=A0A0E3VY06_9BRAD|nr:MULTISPECIES: plasmid partitioning protein RepB [Bradyrhizobium]MBR0868120.1 plasmid partitioning protein RepB [Bradyrhizobium diazoefficiens]MBR0892570.1 plasmid partitioning protein RepB [Bradyrhizobium diazoefficiens]MBR0924533.1 plasmid partitioning protein RepB [Bradyrhizobium diazoefficiens]WLB24513.1 plasmid partitioning protein RepB [Bradyrhizobium japonicum]BAR63575.1 parB-like partition proteins [Bradyrhizobium diazoefficiens]
MTSKRPSGRSILANFGSFAKPETSPDSPSPPVGADAPNQIPARVGAGVIGATQRSLAELRGERDRLQALVDAGGGSELDPSSIDPSPFPDRLPDDSQVDFEALKKLIADEGQKVPIQVRRHPTVSGRYQVVYGHRRWRAALDLGIKVKATVVALSDSELVVAQGIENAARQDLSWIERALFAWRMDQAGIKARDIRAALSVDDPELARLRAVCRAVPVEVIEAIGRAPKAGRPRWAALATAIGEDSAALDRVRKTLSGDKVSELTSDDRFKLVFAAVKQPSARSRSELKLRSSAGKVLGKATFSKGDIKLTVAEEHATGFGAFLEGELPGLVERFFAREGSE